MIKFRHVCQIVFVVFASKVTFGQVVKQKNGYVIFVKYKKGSVLKQKMTVQLKGQSGKLTESQFLTKCLSVDKAGTGTLEVTVPGAGKAPPTKKKVKVDNHGKPVGNTQNGFSGNFVWPATPIKVGGSWDGDMNMMGGGGQGGMAVRSLYKLVGIQTIGGQQVANISATMKVAGTYDMSGNGNIYVRVADGQVHSAIFNMSLNQYSENGAQTKMNVIMTIKTLP